MPDNILPRSSGSRTTLHPLKDPDPNRSFRPRAGIQGWGLRIEPHFYSSQRGLSLAAMQRSPKAEDPSLSSYGHANRPSPPVIPSAAKPTEESCCRATAFPCRGVPRGRPPPPITRASPPAFPHPLVVPAEAGIHPFQHSRASWLFPRQRDLIFIHLPLSSRRRGPIFVHLPCPRGGGNPSSSTSRCPHGGGNPSSSTSRVLAEAGTHLHPPPRPAEAGIHPFRHSRTPSLFPRRREPIFIHLPCPRGGGDPSLPSLCAQRQKEESPPKRGFFPSLQVLVRV